jgi:hypothetical protein
VPASDGRQTTLPTQLLPKLNARPAVIRCSSMSKFCPLAAALRESTRGNKQARTQLRADGGWGGEVIDKIGRRAHLPRPKSVSCFGASFLKAREAHSK